MGKCQSCEVLAHEVRALQSLVEKLTDKNMALADAKTFMAMGYKPGNEDDYYGGASDEIVEHDEFGGEVIRLRAHEGSG